MQWWQVASTKQNQNQLEPIDLKKTAVLINLNPTVNHYFFFGGGGGGGGFTFVSGGGLALTPSVILLCTGGGGFEPFLPIFFLPSIFHKFYPFNIFRVNHY